MSEHYGLGGQEDWSMRTYLHNGVQAANAQILQEPDITGACVTNRETADLARILQLSPTGQEDLARPVASGQLPTGNMAGESFSTLRASESAA